MNDQANTDSIHSPDPAAERWIYGGLRLHEGKKVHAWLPEPVTGEPVGWELLYRKRGSWVVGGIYQAMAARFGEHVHLHGQPGPWLQRYDDAAAVARLEVLDRQARDALALMALERKAAKDPVLADAVRPLLAIAAALVTDAQVRALIAYLTEEIYVARFRRR